MSCSEDGSTTNERAVVAYPKAWRFVCLTSVAEAIKWKFKLKSRGTALLQMESTSSNHGDCVERFSKIPDDKEGARTELSKIPNDETDGKMQPIMKRERACFSAGPIVDLVPDL